MRIVIQRVKSARLEVDDKIVSEIKKGYNVFIGVTRDDTDDNAVKIAKRIATVRLFKDENGKLSNNISQVGGEVLLVSNFTLCDKKGGGGARPDFTMSADKDTALRLYEKVRDILNNEYQVPCKTGIFGAHMQIYTQLDGPINLFQEY